MAETAMVVQGNGHELVPHTQQGILTQDVLRAATEQRKLLAEYVKHNMVPDTDFGKIPGTEKATLLKPGAEKLVDLFRCTPKFKLVRVTEDYDKGLFAYTFRVQLYQRDAGAVLAEGYGSANSREGRYRWRQANRRCPKCSKEAIIKGKDEYGGGWLCYGKKGGCGAKWKDGAAEIESQEVGQVENEDIATLANTILKMAKKRALVDGAIALARVSDLFTQDVEDIGQADEPAKAAPEPVRGAVNEPEPGAGPPPDASLESDLKASMATPKATPSGKSAGAITHDLIESIQKIGNEHHYKNWKPAHEAEVNGLPPPLRKAVWTAYENWAP